MASLFLLPGLPDMQIPGSVLASRQIILLGTINSVVLLYVKSIPHTEAFKTAPGTTTNKLQQNVNEDQHKLEHNSQSRSKVHPVRTEHPGIKQLRKSPLCLLLGRNKTKQRRLASNIHFIMSSSHKSFQFHATPEGNIGLFSC